MAVERSFLVKLIADPRQLIAGFQQVRGAAGEAFGESQTKLQELVPVFGKVQAASAIAFAGITAAAGLSISAAVQAQAEQERLRQILLTTGAATDEQVDALLAQADALQQVGVASAGNITVAQAQLATFDLQFETIEKLTPAIVDYVIAEKGATATGEDFKSMTNGLAQALNGQFGALTRAGFVLDDNTKALISNGTEAERAAAIVDVLSSTYGGFNEAARETAEGRMVALRNSFDDVRTNIGTALLPAFEAIVAALGKFADFAARNSEVMVALGAGFAAVTGAIVAMSIALKVMAIAAALAAAKLTLFGVALSATGIGAIVVVIGLLVSALVLAAMKSEGLRKVLATLINIAIAGFELLVNAVIGVINSFIQWGNVVGDIVRFVGISLPKTATIGEVSFGRIKVGADKAAGAIRGIADASDMAARRLAAANLETGLVSVAQAEAKLAKETDRVNQLRAQALKGGTSIEVLNQALKDQSAAQSVLNALLGDTAKKTGGASGATKEAVKPLEAYTAVLKSAQGASDSYSRAQRNVRDTQKSLTKANEDLAAAQQALLEAQGAGSPGEIADAQRAVAAAERGLTRSKFAQEQSIFAVRDAERKLAEVRADAGSTAQDIREAEIALAEAKLRVVDQEDDQIDSTRKLEAAQRDLRIATDGLREGDAELVPLQKAVTDAQEAQTRAHERNTEALKDEIEAVDDYRIALDELATAIINFPKVAARVGQFGLIPFAPPSPEATNGGGGNGQRNLPDQVVINVNSTVADAELPQKLVDALRTYNRNQGPLNVQIL
jgi:hypothetical protein